MLSLDTIRLAPKVLLHDHLDGGLRPATVLELADQVGYDHLPASDTHTLATWFRTAAHSGSVFFRAWCSSRVTPSIAT